MLLALVDSDYKFIWADIGGRGAASDAQVWNDSDLKAATEDGDLNLQILNPCPMTHRMCPTFILVGKNLLNWLSN